MMGILDFFFQRRRSSAGVAKERLQLVLAHERAGRDAPEFMPALQRDLLAVIGRYVEIKEDLVQVNIGRRDGASLLEINIEFDSAARPVAAAVPRQRAMRSKAMPRQRSARANST
jgi:cell division topological specificity factor